MSLFTKAQSDADRLKMYIYGKQGTGKTITSLHFPSPAVIDAERGTEHYGKKFDFYRLQTTDIKKIHQALDELLEDPGDFKTFVMDPFTLVYDQIVRNKEDQMKIKTGNMNYEIQPLDYKSIKTEVRLLMNKMLSLDMNVIVTARSKPLYAQGKFMEVIGEQPEGHKDMPYMFDVVLELYKAPDGTRMARVEKDRTNNLPHEFEFSYDAFVNYIGMESLSRAASSEKQKSNINHNLERSTEIVFDGEVIYTRGVTAETLGQLQELIKDHDEEDLKETLIEEYEVGSLLDLTEKAATSLVAALKAHEEAIEEE